MKKAMKVVGSILLSLGFILILSVNDTYEDFGKVIMILLVCLIIIGIGALLVVLGERD